MRIDRPLSRPAGALTLVCLLGLGACSSSHTSRRAEVKEMVVRGQYVQAVRAAAELREEFPRDESVRDLHRETTVALYLELGRRATFDGRLEEALEHFESAAELAPGLPVIEEWYDKTIRVLGSDAYELARELHAGERFEEAVAAYDDALRYQPDHLGAREGKARALLQMGYRDGLSVEYYDEGVRALHEYMLQISRTRFGYAQKYRPGEERSERRAQQVDQLLAQRRLAIAQSLEEEGLYAAANKEYQLSLHLDPDLAESQAGRDRTARETEVSRLADKAAMMVLREEWERAHELLAKGLELTVEQKDRFRDLLDDIDDARTETQYERALDYEHDYRYEQAIAVYEEILDEREWYRDARARMSTLQEYIELATELYAEAATVATPAEELLVLRQIQLFWPEYKDVGDRVMALEATVTDDELEAAELARFGAFGDEEGAGDEEAPGDEATQAAPDAEESGADGTTGEGADGTGQPAASGQPEAGGEEGGR